ncbi:MAG: NfeD family protein [Acidimicrobiales bacterium]
MAVVVWALAGGGPGPAAAQDSGDRGRPRPVRVLEASGYLDPVLVDFLEDRIAAAGDEDAEVVVVVLDSPGALVPDTDLARLVGAVGASPVPVTVWVGPTGAQARGGATDLVLAAAVSGISPRSRLGPVRGGAPGAGAGGDVVDADEALAAGVVDVDAPVLGDFIAELDGRTVGDRTLDTATVVGEGRDRRRQPQNVTFAKLPLLSQLMHTAASAPVAYLLLSAGLVLLVFELFTAGVGVAGAVGGGCVVLAAYGLAVLPTSPVGLALLLVGVFGFAVDVQTGVPRAWTAVGTVAYLAGSVALFERGVELGWLPLATGVVGVALMMAAGLPATVRSRFSTPTIGREAMIGELGEAVADVRPDGVVQVRAGLWPARTNRATPISVGERVRVVGIDGPVLEVEPESGGARDHR